MSAPTKKKSLFDSFTRVTPDCPCPKCGRPDWCLIRQDGKQCICQRVKSNRKYGRAGYLHNVRGVRNKIPPMTQKVYISTQQVQDYLLSVTSGGNARMIERQAKLAGGLSLDSLVAMQARYDPHKACLAFPMFDARQRPTGCRFRRSDGRKFSLKGGREGIFISQPFRFDRTIWIAEGPTDAAALIEIGFTNVLGRPSCSGGVSIIGALLANCRDTQVIVVADPDEPGIHGAGDLIRSIPNPAIALTGPSDIREFLCKTKLPSVCRSAIIEGLTNEDDESKWRIVHRNPPGRFHNFEARI